MLKSAIVAYTKKLNAIDSIWQRPPLPSDSIAIDLLVPPPTPIDAIDILERPLISTKGHLPAKTFDVENFTFVNRGFVSMIGWKNI